MINYKLICYLFCWGGTWATKEAPGWLIYVKGNHDRTFWNPCITKTSSGHEIQRFLLRCSHQQWPKTWLSSLQFAVYQIQGAFYMVILPSHIAFFFQESFLTNQHNGNVTRGPGFVAIAQMASAHVPGDGFSYLGGAFASSYGAGWRWWYFTSAGKTSTWNVHLISIWSCF